MIVGFNVKCNDNGLYSLNDIHRASGGKAKNTPARWLERKGTQNLIDSALKRINRERSASQKWDMVLDVNNGGVNHGVYAHELLVVSYAGWIDSDFQIEVNHTFLETIKERAKALELENKKLVDFKDDFYRNNLANKHLLRSYGKLSDDVVKGINMIINNFKWRKKVYLSDLMDLPLISRKASSEALEYAKRNIIAPIDDNIPPNKQEVTLK